MKIYQRIFLVAMALTTATLLQAQSGAPADTTTTSKKDDAVAKVGIRFVLQESQPGGDVFMALGEKKYKQFTLRSSKLTDRQPYPATNAIRLYDKEPAKGEKATPFLTMAIPGDRTQNVICLITGAPGNYKPIFIPESQAKRPYVLFINNMDQDYMIEVKNPPMGDPSQINLKAGETYVFGKGLTTSLQVKDYSCNIMMQCTLKNGEKRWIKDRSFMVAPAKTNGTIFLLTPSAPGSQVMMFQKILVFPANS